MQSTSIDDSTGLGIGIAKTGQSVTDQKAEVVLNLADRRQNFFDGQLSGHSIYGWQYEPVSKVNHDEAHDGVARTLKEAHLVCVVGG